MCLTGACKQCVAPLVSALANCLATLQVLKNQRNDPLLVATNASNTSESPTLVLRFPPGVPSVSLRCMQAFALTQAHDAHIKMNWTCCLGVSH